MDNPEMSSEEFYSACEDSYDLIKSNSFHTIEKSDGQSQDTPVSQENREEIFYQLKWNPPLKLHDKEASETILAQTQEIDISSLSSSSTWVLEFSFDGRYLAVGSEDGSIGVFESQVKPGRNYVLANTPVQYFLEHSARVTSLSFSLSVSSQPNYYLLSASEDYTVKLWEISNYTAVATFYHDLPVNAVSFDPLDADLFITAGQDKFIKIYSVSNIAPCVSFKTSREINCLRYSPCGKVLAVGMNKGEVAIYASTDGPIKLRYIKTLKCRNRRGFKSRGRKVVGIFFRDKDHILVSTLDSRIRYVNITNGNTCIKFKGHKLNKGPASSSFSNDGNFVMSGSDCGSIFLWKNYPTLNCAVKVNACESYLVRKKKNATEFSVFAPSGLTNTIAELPTKENKTVKEVIVSCGSKSTLKIFFLYYVN